MKTILFIESGVHGGGSFISLKKHIKVLDRTKFRPVVVFFNENSHISFFENENISTYVVKDKVFSTDKSSTYWFLNALFMKGIIFLGVVKFLKFLHQKSIEKVTEICLKEKVDLIHLNTELFRDRIGLIVGVNLSIPVISHLRSKYKKGSIHYNKAYIKYANQNVKKFLAVSHDTELFWGQDVGIDTKKCEVIYDYFEPQNLNIVSNHQGIITKNLNFSCVANLVPVKGHVFLLESLAPTLIKYNAQLLLAGQGEDDYVRLLKQKTKDLQIENNVSFLGFQNNIPSLLSNSDIVFLLSQREGLPNILIESMGLGCVVVATEVGGIPEIITNRINGFTIAYGSKNEVGNTVEDILKNTYDLELIRKEAKNTVIKKFNKESYKFKINLLYD